MKGLSNEVYIILLMVSNAVAILQLIAAVNWPRIARWTSVDYLFKGSPKEKKSNAEFQD
jgi:hypothetical protein